ncbi:MAG: 4-hydroxythreonine-4-phosphate dehydrogenase PdxA [Longimicrobiales bacterium]|nr:4-hydroxythreonine-4-phosphate dehydrogenase PdxA [Longimicrobiales bacterium]
MTIRLAVTLGDPRGIGPEVAAAAGVRLRREDAGVEVLMVGDAADPAPLRSTGLDHQPVGAFDGSQRSAGAAAGRAVELAVAMALEGRVDGVVTAPLHKPALHEAGYTEPGHTELLQRLTGASHVGMLMAAERTRTGGALRVLLATTHLPLRAVPDRVTTPLLVAQTRLLHDALRQGWAIPAPRLALCALNPHASDDGLFGDEEARVFRPAVAILRAGGVDVSDPLPADTVFGRALAGEFDAVVAPYHDVGMATFKTVSFGAGVNVTLGLPFPRTSPDHGTAFALAGRGRADPSSMLAALRLAARLASPPPPPPGRSYSGP